MQVTCTAPETEFRELIANAVGRVPAPESLKAQSGGSLPGFDSENFARAAVHFASARESGRFDDAAALLQQLRVAAEVESAALSFLRLIFPPELVERYRTPAPCPERGVLDQCVLNMYAAFTGQPAEEIAAERPTWTAKAQALWNQLVPDEDHVTADQLGAFYNEESVPQADQAFAMLASPLAIACRAVPVAIASQIKNAVAFDYGGGGGWAAQALARTGLRRVTLIEESQRLLDFARWRNSQVGTTNVTFLRESELCTQMGAHRAGYDFGLCTEVLEHVLDVEGTVERLATLLKPGGYLFMTASFGLYPYPSHLRANLRFAGREHELMADFGFQHMPLDVTFPMPARGGLYRRQA